MVFYRLRRGRKDDAPSLTLGFERVGDARETDRWNNILSFRQNPSLPPSLPLSLSLSLSLSLYWTGEEGDKCLGWGGSYRVPWLRRFVSSALRLLVSILPRISNHSGLIRGQLSLSPSVFILDQWEETPGVRLVEKGAAAMFVGPIRHHQYSLPGEISQAKNRSRLSFVRKKTKTNSSLNNFFIGSDPHFIKTKFLSKF